MAEVKQIKVDYATVVTLRTIQGKSIQEVADHFGITWAEAQKAVRDYGLVVAKSEKAPKGDVAKAYEIVLSDTDKVVVKKEKAKVVA